jgi:hypothetical protein
MISAGNSPIIQGIRPKTSSLNYNPKMMQDPSNPTSGFGSKFTTNFMTRRSKYSTVASPVKTRTKGYPKFAISNFSNTANTEGNEFDQIKSFNSGASIKEQITVQSIDSEEQNLNLI